MGIAALVLGIMGMVLCIIPSFAVTQAIGGTFALVAIVLGFLKRRNTIIEDRTSGLATAGLVLGIVAFVCNSAVFASCMVCQVRCGERMDEVRKEIRRAVEEGKRQVEDKQRRGDGGRGGDAVEAAEIPPHSQPVEAPFSPAP
jgi:membrane-bound ClpP family serine protease